MWTPLCKTLLKGSLQQLTFLGFFRGRKLLIIYVNAWDYLFSWHFGSKFLVCRMTFGLKRMKKKKKFRVQIELLCQRLKEHDHCFLQRKWSKTNYDMLAKTTAWRYKFPFYNGPKRRKPARLKVNETQPELWLRCWEEEEEKKNIQASTCQCRWLIAVTSHNSNAFHNRDGEVIRPDLILRIWV